MIVLQQKHGRMFFAASLALVVAADMGRAESGAGDAARIEFFEKKVRPILVDNCYNCHSANTNSQGELRVDDRNGLIHGGASGPAVVPGRPEDSLLIQAIRYESFEMPPNKRLSEDQIADLVTWIRDGAAWPKVEASIPIGSPNEKYDRLRREHWAWQPLGVVSPPQVADAAWARDDADRFILAKLEEKGLRPVGDADKPTLIRRVTFDLTGLPPMPDEVDAFIADDSPNALETLVDRLLASSAFGERWGRHWLDVARYGESTGSSRNVPYPHAWRYRDYVVEAFNTDKPFDRFLREQIAGDLLPANSPDEKAEQLVATGFLALGVKDVNQRFKVRFVMDNIDEQIDAVTRSVLALSVSCARCHDHKFDPIPTTDYYALAGIFHSTDLCAGVRNKMGGGGLDYYDTSMLLNVGMKAEAASPLREEIEQAQKAVAEARAEFEALRNSPEGDEKAPDGRPKRAVARQKMNRLQQELFALTDPAALGQVALGVREAKTIGDTEIRIRGEAEKLGPVVPRGFLTAVPVPDAPRINPDQSGRLELARWLTSTQNPLTPRVMANRVWRHLFGKGLVESVDNFGVTGDAPSHPELLDHLAARFVRDGWSVKKLVRSLVLTRAYQLGAETSQPNLSADPANRFVWRHSPRRLDAEEIRDATLAAAGTLDLARPEASPAKAFQVVEVPDDGPQARQLAEAALASTHRSVYLPLLRGLTPTALEVFDFAEQGMVTGSRDTTTVATQALYLLNDPFVRQQSRALAERLLEADELDDGGRIDLAYRLTVGRAATTREIERATAYLGDYEAAVQEALAAATPAGEPQEPAQRSGPGSAADAGTAWAEPSKVQEESIQPADSKRAAWASFCQALLGSAEFRYIK